MLVKLGDGKYRLELDLKNTVDDIISNMTKVSPSLFSEFINDVLIETIIPRVVTDIVYTELNELTETTHVVCKYGTDSYNVIIGSKMESLKGLVYNVIPR